MEPPLLIQRDLTIWLAVDHPEFESMREGLMDFAELVKSPEHLHLYRVTPLSLWNAAARGLEAEEICRLLHNNSRLGLPQTVRHEIHQLMERYGLLRLESDQEGRLWLASSEEEFLYTIVGNPAVQRFLICKEEGPFRQGLRGEEGEPHRVEIDAVYRGRLKQELLRLGYPVEDAAGYLPGEPLPIQLRKQLDNGAAFELRTYQQAAVDAFADTRRIGGGCGVVVLPCGAGKTVVGIASMARFSCETLILTPNTTSVEQWKREILDKTDLSQEAVGTYTGEHKEVCPVTIATYQVLTHRSSRDGEFAHLDLFHRRRWGLIIYDEVHLLPAPVFRVTAELQACRRLGLTATLVREDGCEADVYSLVGPKRYEVPWKRLEEEGFLARVQSQEIRIPFSKEASREYEAAPVRGKIRVASENPRKLEALRALLDRHRDDRVLIIGQYLDQLRLVAKLTDSVLLCGEVPQEEREKTFQAFREGRIKRLVVSRVANFAVDLPDANVAIQISGSFGSRQEEAQRLGRILRPKKGLNDAYFYTLVTADSREAEFATNRQMFLLEQGYRYEVCEMDEVWMNGLREKEDLPL